MTVVLREKNLLYNENIQSRNFYKNARTPGTSPVPTII